MPSLNAVRALLGLPVAAADLPITSLNDALALCPEPPARDVIRAVGELAAREMLPLSGLPLLLGALRDAVMSGRPEQALTQLLVAWTGGLVEIRSSWGDLVASGGRAAGESVTIRLVHRERHVGSVTLALPAPWTALVDAVTEYALLARLHSAAAGASRRRVGERLLEAFLSGSEDLHALGWEPFAVAVASFSVPLSIEAREDALDVLAAVGEGYLTERKLTGYSTVRDGQAVWLWSTLNLPTEGRELHAALIASTLQDVRLGVSAPHVLQARGASSAVRSAYAEARQALDATRSKRGYTTFHGMNPFFALLSDGRLNALQAQVKAQLAALNDSGRIESTLRAYLAHSGSLSELAAQEGVHINTLRYRLRRAEEVLGGRLTEPAVLARLYLALEATNGKKMEMEDGG